MRARARWLALLAVAGLAAALATPVGGNGDAAPVGVDPSARLPSGDSAFEYWDFTARFESGHLMVARFLITNTGPGDHNAVAFGHVIEPSGKAWVFKNGRTRDRWKLSPDRLRIDIGSSHLDLHGPNPLVQVHKDDVTIDLILTASAGRRAPAGAVPRGYRLDLVEVSAPIVGTLRLADMSEPISLVGRGALVHTWGFAAEGDLALRRIDVFSLDDSEFYLLDFLNPEGLRSRWVTGRHPGSATRFSTTQVLVEAQPGEAGEKGYPIPSALELTANGIVGKITLSKPFLRQDPLSVLPQPFRFFAGMTMDPLQVWAESGFDVTLRAGPDVPSLHIQGSGVTMVSFVNRVTP